MSGADLLLVGLAVGLVVALTLGARSVAAHSGMSLAPTAKVGLAATAWLGLTATLALNGVLADWTSRPPRVGWLPLAAMVMLVSLSRTSYATRVIQTVPATWPLALQSFRILVEVGLLWLWQDGRAPIQVTFEGRNFDIVAGVTAPLLAAVVYAHGLRSWAVPLVLTWNVVGLALLANIMFTAATSIPGPMQVAWPGGSFAALASWPVVWIPSFMAPVAVFLHIVSIRQVLSVRNRVVERSPA